MGLAPGEYLSDNLQLERELGAGGMGSVWVARHTALGSQVAVKVLARAGGARGEAQRARFEREAKVVARLDHPHIVRVFDLGITMDGDPFLVMELLRGEDLEKRLGRGRLDLATLQPLVAQICAALAAAHATGVIHRDIKPANIFLLEGVADPFVKLVDFGVAKLASGDMSMTKTGDVIGTPFYMSPEQFLRPKDIDGRSDLWSLAVVIYASLARALPFNGDTLTAVGMAVATGSFAPLRTHCPDLPPALDHFMSRALSVDPDRRYGSAQQLGEAFARACSAPSVSIHAPSLPPSSPPPVPAPAPAAPARSRRWVAVGALSVVVIGSMGAAATILSRRPQKARSGASSTASSHSPGSASAPSAPPIATARAKTSSAPAPAPVVGHTYAERQAEALRIAKARDPKAELGGVAMGDVRADRAKEILDATFTFIRGGTCFAVVLSEEGGSATDMECLAFTRPLPLPRCTPDAVLTRWGAKPSDVVTLIYSSPTGTPAWTIDTGPRLVTIPDDCKP